MMLSYLFLARNARSESFAPDWTIRKFASLIIRWSTFLDCIQVGDPRIFML